MQTLNIYVSKYRIKTLQPAMGHMLETSEQAGEQMSMPVRCDAQKGSRSEVLSEALGRSSKQREPPRNPAQEKLWSKTKRGKGEQREKRPESVRQHFVLSVRDPFFFLVLLLL